jgi:hypothetical protein
LIQILEINKTTCKTIVPKLKIVWKCFKILQKNKTPIIIGDFSFKIFHSWKEKIIIPFYFLKSKSWEILPKEK